MNTLVYSVITYIIIMMSLMMIRPSFIYDYRNMKYKEFGSGNNKTYLTLPVISIIFAFFIFGIFHFLMNTDKTDKIIRLPYYVTEDEIKNIQMNVTKSNIST